jgi:hypothetical protein
MSQTYVRTFPGLLSKKATTCVKLALPSTLLLKLLVAPREVLRYFGPTWCTLQNRSKSAGEEKFNNAKYGCVEENFSKILLR